MEGEGGVEVSAGRSAGNRTFPLRFILMALLECRGSEVMGWESLVRIDGETAAQDRGEAVRRFRTSASCRIALLSITAAGTGLDFASASAVVFAELPHDVGLALQVTASSPSPSAALTAPSFLAIPLPCLSPSGFPTFALHEKPKVKRHVAVLPLCFNTRRKQPCRVVLIICGPAISGLRQRPR